MERKLLNDVALGAFIVAALALLAYMSIAVGGLKVGNAIVVSAQFDNAAGLVKDGAVMIAGVNVGSVDSLAVAHDKALVKLRLKTDAQVRQDVKAAIRMKSLLGEKYIELLPQSETAPLMENGGTIAETTVPVEVDTVMKQIGPVLEDVDPKDVSAIVHSLALTLNGRGETIGKTLDNANATLGTLNRFLTKNEGNLDHLVASLDKASGRAPDLMERLDRLTASLEPSAKALETHGPSLVARLDRVSGQLEPATEALAKKGPGLIDKTDRALGQMPRTLDLANSSLAKLPRTLDTLDRLVTRLEGTLDKLEPVLDQTRDRQLFDKDGSFKVKAKLF